MFEKWGTNFNQKPVNLLLEKIEYKIEEGTNGVWKRFLYPSGHFYEEYTSKTIVMGFPLVHITKGVNPETGKRKMARGIIAIGRIAKGFIAIGQLAFGIVTFSQLGIGLLFSLAQLSIAPFAIGQGAIGYFLGIGQIATGKICIAQIGYGTYVLAQLGFGEHVWSVKHVDPMAKEFFISLFYKIKALLP